MSNHIVAHLILALALTLSAPALAKPNRVLADFGNKEGVFRITEDFVSYLVTDPRIKHYFEGVDGERVTHNIAVQLCELLGGDCIYKGMSMKVAHARFKLTTADFNALVEDLQKAMDKHMVPFHSQNKLLGKLAPMWKDIVTR